MNKPDKKINPNDYQPKRFGLRYNPPQIVIEYLVPSTGKLYHHKIRLNSLKTDSNLQEVIKEIYDKHYMYLDNKKINPSQLVKLVEKLANIKNKAYRKDEESGSLNGVNNENYNENIGSLPNPNPSPKNTSKAEIKELDDDEDENYYKFFDYENEDLNKLENEELNKRKEEMEKLYSKNSVKMGDDDFVYDVRVSIYVLNICIEYMY